MAGQYPGDMIDGAARGITGAAKGIISSVASGLRGAGENVQGAVDGPFKAVGVKQSPLMIIHDPLNGVIGAVENAVNSGVISSVEMVGHGITSGVDRIPETFLGSDMQNFPKMKPFWRR